MKMDDVARDKMKMFVAFLAVAIVLIAGVAIYDAARSSGTKDNLVGNWYCMEQEKYLMDGEYYTAKYVEGALPMFVVFNVNDGLFNGVFQGSAVTGVITETTANFTSPAGREYNYIFNAQYDANDKNIIYCTEVRFVDGRGDTISSAYYVLAKDVSKYKGSEPFVLDVSGEWTTYPEQSKGISSTGVEVDVPERAMKVTRTDGHLFRAEAYYPDGTVSVAGSMELVQGQSGRLLRGLLVDNGLCAHSVSVSGNLIYLSTATFTDIDNIPEMEVWQACYVRSGYVPPEHKCNVDVTGMEYKITEIRGMDTNGKITSLNPNIPFTFKKTADNDILFVCESKTDAVSIIGGGYFTIDISGDISFGTACLEIRRMSGTIEYATCFVEFNDDMSKLTLMGCSSTGSNWYSNQIEMEIVK